MDSLPPLDIILLLCGNKPTPSIESANNLAITCAKKLMLQKMSQMQNCTILQQRISASPFSYARKKM